MTRCFATLEDGSQCPLTATNKEQGLCDHHKFTARQWARVNKILAEKQSQETDTQYQVIGFEQDEVKT